jgi:hypothetical protein
MILCYIFIRSLIEKETVMLEIPSTFIARHRNKNPWWVEFMSTLSGVDAPTVLPTELSVVCSCSSVNSLEKLLQSGIQVRYVVVPSPSMVALIKHPALDWRIFNGPNPEMKTFHFILGENPKTLWIEREHLPSSLEAKDCEWLPPSLANSDGRYGSLRDTFEKAWEKAIRPDDIPGL